MPAQITNICKMEMTRVQTIQAVMVALTNGEVRLYSDKYLITTIKNDVRLGFVNPLVQDIVTAMTFGVYGREEGCLLMNYKSGGLAAKILQRQANLQASTLKPGPPPEQDIPLNVPKKTKVFVDLTTREKESSVSMHRIF